MSTPRLSNKPKFESTLHISATLKNKLTRIFNMHTILYNYALGLYEADPEIQLADKLTKLNEYIAEHNITDYIHCALMLEMYYQHRKAKREIFKEKLLTDIGYLSFNSDGLTLSEDGKSLHIEGLEEDIRLETTMDTELFRNKKYINLSYSFNQDSFKLALFQ